MAEETFHLVFRGEVLEGQDRSAVAKRLATLLKLDAPRVRALFSGEPVVLKRDVPKAAAARYQAAFRDAGARLRVSPATAGKAAAAEAPARKPSLAERLAEQEATAAPGAAGNVAEAPGRPIQATLPEDLAAGGDLDLAAPEGDLIGDDERPDVTPVAVDVSHLSAAPPESGSFEDVLPPSPPPPPPPDVSALSVDEAGVDLVEPQVFEELSVDLSALSLADPGADLLEGEDAPLPGAVPDPDFDLAAPGEDLETLPEEAPPPAPDVSHLRIE